MQRGVRIFEFKLRTEWFQREIHIFSTTKVLANIYTQNSIVICATKRVSTFFFFTVIMVTKSCFIIVFNVTLRSEIIFGRHSSGRSNGTDGVFRRVKPCVGVIRCCRTYTICGMQIRSVRRIFVRFLTKHEKKPKSVVHCFFGFPVTYCSEWTVQILPGRVDVLRTLY